MANIDRIEFQISGSDLSAAAISSASEGLKNFEAQSKTSTDRMRAHVEAYRNQWIAATAGFVAAGAALNQAMEYAEMAAKALQVESSFKIMADAAGVNSEKMIESMKRATRATIDDSDLMQKASKLMLAGFNPSQIEKFSEVAVTASRYMGVNISEGFDALGDAIANKTPKALNRLGAVTREQMKIVQDAITAGADSTVIFDLAIDNLSLKQLMLKGTQDQATIALQQFHAQVRETKEEIGKGLIVATQKLYAEFQVLAAGTLGLTGNMAFLVSMYAKYRALVYDAVGDEKKAADNRKFADDAMQFSKDAWGARNDLMEKATVNMMGAAAVEDTATKQQIANAKAKVDAQMAALSKIAGATEATARADKPRALAEKNRLDRQKEFDQILLAQRNFEDSETAEALKAKEERNKLRIALAKDVMEQEAKLEDFWRGVRSQGRQEEAKIWADMRKVENDAMIADVKYRLDAAKAQYEDFWAQFMATANQVGGETGRGLGMMGAGMKGMTDVEMKADKYSREIEAAKQHYLDLEIAYRDHGDRMNLMTQAAAQRDQAIERASANQRAHLVQNMCGMIAGAMYTFYLQSGEKNREAFELYKIFAIAQAIVSTYLAAAQALATYSYPYNILVAAMVTAAGMIYVSSIASQKMGGGTGGTGSPAPAGGGGYTYTQPTEPTWQKETAAVKAGPVINIHVYGNIVDQDKFARELIPSLTKAWEDNSH